MTSEAPGFTSVSPRSSGRGVRLFLALTAAIAGWGYYSSIDSLIKRPWQAQHRSPAVLARELATVAGAQWRPISTTARDGVRLDGWLFTPQLSNGRAILVMHQMGGSRLRMLEHVRWLLRAGFICLVPDGRGHGTSGGDLVTYGIEERHDVIAWTAALRRQRPEIEDFAGLGVSLGGSVLLQGAAQGAPLAAIVADSTGADVKTPYILVRAGFAIPELFSPLLTPLVEPIFLNARIRYGLRLEEASPETAIRKVTVPVLLIHGKDDWFVPVENARRLRASNPRYATLWEVPGAGHSRIARRAGKEYETRVVEFLLKHSFRQP